MKNLAAGTLLIILGVLIPADLVFAVARAPFPDASRLQPLPEIAHPDFSNNVQRTPIGTEPESSVQQDQYTEASVPQSEEIPADPAGPTETSSVAPRYGLLVLFAGLALVFFGLIAWFMRVF